MIDEHINRQIRLLKEMRRMNLPEAYIIGLIPCAPILEKYMGPLWEDDQDEDQGAE